MPYNFSLTPFETQIYDVSEVNGLINNVDSAILNVQAQLDTEVSDRQNADIILQQNIDNLNTIFSTDITDLQAQITGEITDRTDADTVLQNQIDTIDGNIKIDMQSDTLTTPFATSSVAYVDITGVSITAKGTLKYRVNYTCTSENTNENNDNYFALFVNGNLSAGTEIKSDNKTGNESYSISGSFIVNVNSGDILTLRVKTDAGTATVTNVAFSVLGFNNNIIIP